MRIALFALLVFNISSLYSQPFECEQYIYEYCNVANEDETESILCIDNPTAFCNGVLEALNTPKLYYKVIGDPSHANPCVSKSYERLGVKQIFTGDIILDDSIFDHNSGYNYIMTTRIKNELGDNYSKLGVIDSSWISFNENTMKLIQKSIKITSKTDSTLNIIMDSSFFKESGFSNLDEVIIKDRPRENHYTIDQLFQGIILKSSPNKRTYIIFDTSNFIDPNFCKNEYGTLWFIPILNPGK